MFKNLLDKLSLSRGEPARGDVCQWRLSVTLSVGHKFECCELNKARIFELKVTLILVCKRKSRSIASEIIRMVRCGNSDFDFFL